MKLRTLLNKTKDAIKYHFAQPTMIFRNKEAITNVRMHTVREDEVARPDLIAIEYYGDQTKVDIILKWNGISDPFSLVPGDILEIPPSSVPFTKLERPNNFEENPIKTQFLQGKRLSKKDDRRIEALKKKYNKEVLLPPNVIPFGKKNYKFDKNGNIIFGAHAQNGDVNPRNKNYGNDPVVDDILADLASGSGAGGSGSGSGSGSGLTANELENLLTSGAGSGFKNTNSSGSGSGSGGGKATNTGTNSSDGSGPAGSNSQGISNDDAPCN